jgi:hypothetical protein
MVVADSPGASGPALSFLRARAELRLAATAGALRRRRGDTGSSTRVDDPPPRHVAR